MVIIYYVGKIMLTDRAADNFDLEECKKQIVEELEGTFVNPIANIDIDYDSDLEDKRRRIMFARRKTIAA